MTEKPKTGTTKEHQLARSAAFAAVMALRHAGSSASQQPAEGVAYNSPVRRVRTGSAGTWTRRGSR